LEFAVDLLLDNGYPLELIFEKMNSRIKTLINNKRSPSIRDSMGNYNNSNNNKKFVVLLYIKEISELISLLIKLNTS